MDEDEEFWLELLDGAPPMLVKRHGRDYGKAAAEYIEHLEAIVRLTRLLIETELGHATTDTVTTVEDILDSRAAGVLWSPHWIADVQRPPDSPSAYYRIR